MTDTTTETEPVEDGYHKRISVAASPATVFALLTEPERLRRWQSVVSSVDLEVGGEYRHLVVPGAVARGRFTEIEPDRRLVYTWGWEGETAGVAPGSSTVSVVLSPDGDRTIIDFTHDGLPDAEAVTSHADGWNHFVDRLATAAEEGDAGPDPWAAGPEDMDLVGVAEASLALMLDQLRSVSPDDLERATPCAAFTVAELVDHLVGSLGMIAISGGGTAAAPSADAAVESRVADAAAAALTAWRQRGLDGEVDFGGGSVPAQVPITVAVAELFVHAWDVAQVTGRPFDPAGHVVVMADGAVRGVIPPDRGDSFGPPLPEEGLDPVGALMAFTGRTV